MKELAPPFLRHDLMLYVVYPTISLPAQLLRQQKIINTAYTDMLYLFMTSVSANVSVCEKLAQIIPLTTQ